MLFRKTLLIIAVTSVLAGCSHTRQTKLDVPLNRFAVAHKQEQAIDTDIVIDDDKVMPLGMQPIKTLRNDSNKISDQSGMLLGLSTKDQLQLAANQMNIGQFVQLVFAEQLGVNYIISDSARASSAKITLNISEPVSSRRLVMLVSELLQQNDLTLSRSEDIFYINTKQTGIRNQAIIGQGRRAIDVPESAQPILQIIPLRFGVTNSIERTIRSLSDAKISSDTEQNALFVEGNRSEILRIIDLVNLLDTPANRGKYVSMYHLSYISPDEFVTAVSDLLKAEGIMAGKNLNSSDSSALLFVPVSQISAVAAFSGDAAIMQRMEYWAAMIDKPSQSSAARYFIYHPRYARASDLGESVGPLLGDFGSGNTNVDRSRDTQSAMPRLAAGSQPSSSQQNNKAKSAGGAISVNGEDVKMTVDDRSNSIIFFTSGQLYQSLLPIIRSLDVMPKQILLDATIAEVTLTDEFAQGFEFAFREGKFSGGTLGALGAANVGGLSLNWQSGLKQVLAGLSASTTLINVLSNPTLVVRDGVAANISVGNDIPTIGATISDPQQSNRQTTVINYRKTGINLAVTPTVNSQGLVVLQIDQSISNTTETGPSLQGSPSIFERSIKTEVLAQSGQTILLGGLISDNGSSSNTHVPLLSALPLIGNLFKGTGRKSEKTELIIFITPTVIDSVDQWPELRARIAEGLTNLNISE
ncbi:hypothetical protein E0Z06_09765 [Rheinheimera sp. D18]|uniref:secretin N-terminal domain-containing protein n=1 Tax=Rheinheimera sp. D18 TaxID=2545632 RepID=UPI00104E7B5F|nr:secretin N-terminal domain-containing protein [Rheinheimera sp. D18]QBL09782.1 hypothetical protein E0Z06_09765 [Rheinheimera sp. D18]